MVQNNATIGARLLWIINTLIHQLIAVVAVYILWIVAINTKPDSSFFWHVVLSTLGYIPIMAEAIILFVNENVWSQYISRTTKYWIHGVFLILSTLIISIGIGLEIDSKGSSGEHFKSLHAIFGLVSWIFVLLGFLIGFLAANTKLLPSMLPPVLVKLLHNVFGMLGFGFGCLSLGYGIYTHYFKFYTSEESRLAGTICLGLATVWTLVGPLKSAYDQLRSLFRI